MPGSWEYQPSLTTYDAFVFYNAIGQHEDYFYHPIAVAKQVVNGINYRFMTIAEPQTGRVRPSFRPGDRLPAAGRPALRHRHYPHLRLGDQKRARHTAIARRPHQRPIGIK